MSEKLLTHNFYYFPTQSPPLLRHMFSVGMSFCILMSQNTNASACKHAVTSFFTSSSSWNFWTARCFFKGKNKWKWDYARHGSVATFTAVISLPLPPVCIFNFWITPVVLHTLQSLPSRITCSSHKSPHGLSSLPPISWNEHKDES